jgi:hypothetical protein
MTKLKKSRIGTIHSAADLFDPNHEHSIVANTLWMEKFGIGPAFFLSQLYYRIHNKKYNKGPLLKGEKWVCYTTEEWGDQLVVSSTTIKRYIKKFIELGIIKKLSPRSNHLTICHDTLQKILEGGE